MNYETDIPNRRNLINAAFRILRAKDPIATMNKFKKKYGSEIRDAHAFAYEATGNCMAVLEDRVDVMLSMKFGWKTIDEIKKQSIADLRAEIVEIK